MALSTWTWCAMPGMSRATKMAVDTTNYGDGYVERTTRGLNPNRPTWTLSFPFVGKSALQTMDAFLLANSVPGFYFTPPDDTAQIVVTADEWSATIVDQINGATDIVGTLQVTFARQFNPVSN